MFSESSLTTPKRSKRNSDGEYIAESGGDATVNPTPAAALNSYKCGVCGKFFPSPQALGGHKTCHRSKSPITNTDKASEASNHTSGSNGRHRCSTCGKRFASGQALGGHMRKHYAGVIDGRRIGAISCNGGNGDGRSGVTSSSDSVTISYSGDSSSDFTRSPRNFDLNCPPPSSPEPDLTLKL